MRVLILTRHRLALVRQRFDARQFFAFQEFKRGSTAGGNVRDFVGDAGSIHSGHGIASSDDRGRARIFRDGVSDLERALGEWRQFEHAHRSVPDNRSRP